MEIDGFKNASQQWCTRSWGFHTVCGGIVRGDNCFRLRLIGVVDIRRVFCFEDGVVRILPGAGGFTNPSQSATSQLWGSGWGFHTVRGGIDTEDDRFSLRFVGVVYMEGYPI